MEGFGKFKKPVLDMFGSESEDEEEEIVVKPKFDAVENFDDDTDGYLKYNIGDEVTKRYEVCKVGGKGVFGGVLKAIDREQNKRVVAIKIIRNKEIMFNSGMKEIKTLTTLNTKDPEDKRHVVRMLNNFTIKGHLCIVFEALDMNVRELIKKYGKDVGLNMKATQLYAQQLFRALKFIHSCGYLHADIKPDNILVNETRTSVKICDLGSAAEQHENDITEYLASRFYRPPEVVLGLPYGYAVDVWSMGCCIFEIFTGKILFPGRSNNEMMRLFLELKGQFPKKLLSKAAFREKHFDEDLITFLKQEYDTKTSAIVRVSKVTFTNPTRDMLAMLNRKGAKLDELETRKLTQLKDFLDKCLALDPSKRITAEQALTHPFLRE
eukprot:TRINITY_DN861_c1_g1_i3.p1 TRINITY_DN861_c1_g1~~TRINITY_DN861_c1_g1_i3.p1  ORF type:complete len:380 (-),score=110.91 TRINITY_DN861_c1_g1_i3:118-1257(-)